MLRKCLKHEFRATGRVMLSIYIAVLSLSVVTRFAFHYLESDADYGSFLNIVSTLTLVLFFIGLAGTFFSVIILAVKRFYASFFSDEGYLTMTLPVSTHKLLASRLIVSAVWYALTALVCVSAVRVMALSGSDWNSFLSGFGNILRDLWKALPSLDGKTIASVILLAVELLLVMVFASMLFTLLIYAAMSIGYSFNKGKKLLSVVFAFLFYHVSQIATVIFGVGTVDLVLKEMPKGNLSSLSMMILPLNAGAGAGIAYLVLVCAVFYFVTHFFITKKLNLE